MKYFMQTIRFSPNFSVLGFEKTTEGYYKNTVDDSLWIERSLLDLGWGQEKGLCRVPLLFFEQLLDLVFTPFDIRAKKITDEQYNFWGALSILLEDYPLKFLDIVEAKFRKNEISFQKNKYLLDLIDKELFCEEKDIPKIKEDIRLKYQKWYEIKKILN